MWRDPMDELIDDLERVLPAKQQTEWGELLVEFQIWTDRMLSTPLRPEDLDGTAEPVTSDLADDPAFQDFQRRWRAWFKGGA